MRSHGYSAKEAKLSFLCTIKELVLKLCKRNSQQSYQKKNAGQKQANYLNLIALIPHYKRRCCAGTEKQIRHIASLCGISRLCIDIFLLRYKHKIPQAMMTLGVGNRYVSNE